MSSRTFLKLFTASLVVLPGLFAVFLAASGESAMGTYINFLFVATVLVELLALLEVIRARKMFSPGDPGYLTWTLILAFLSIRLVAEARLITMTLGLVPAYHENDPVWLFIYVRVLRYLYSISDLVLIGALIATIRAYKGTGLKFYLITIDYFYILAICAIPATTYLFRQNLLSSGMETADAIYRLVAVGIGAVIASLCIWVRRYVLQMGGGAVARVWRTVVIAGIARDGSFLALTLMNRWWPIGAEFGDQYLLWVFACCWVLAGTYQQEVLTPVASTRPAPTG